MRLTSLSLPALGLIFAGATVQADCMYYGENNTLTSANHGNHHELLGDPIPLDLGTFDIETAHDIGQMMSFECLYKRDEKTGAITLRDRGERTPKNIDQLPAIHQLTRSLPVSIVFDDYLPGPLMTADVSCEKGIVLTLNTEFFLNSDALLDPYSTSSEPETYQDKSTGFQETVLSLLSNIAQRSNTNAMGHYQISAPLGPVSFSPQTNGPNCAAVIS